MAEKLVKELIKANKVMIFSKSYCPYCTMAKQQFQKLNFNFTSLEIEDRADCSEIQAVLGQMTGATSVPRVFINGEFVGGGTDVKKLYEDGKLAGMLA